MTHVLKPTSQGVYRAIKREEIETLLRSGQLYCRPYGSLERWYQMRSNGKTKTWKRDPARFRIPFKFGFRGHGAITESDLRRFASADGTNDGPGLIDPVLHPDTFRHVDDLTSRK